MVLDELGSYLSTQYAWPLASVLFLGRIPDAPDDCITLLEYPGLPGDRAQDQAVGVEKPNVQVIARSADYRKARRWAEQAYTALSRVTNTALGGTYYLHIVPHAAPALIGRDENDLTLIGFSSTAWKRQSAQ